ncbi:hypothetical protein GE09DRAFT_86810 [Coniochaeta sp. 2T2.1]|nr:hypothetical protein GE09DRAFT_86810 [Coniochaeta sp. 2T2.1]
MPSGRSLDPLLKLLRIGRTNGRDLTPASWHFPLVLPQRKAERQDPNRRSLTDLSDEILLLIIDHLQDVSPKSVINLAMVSSRFHGKARYVQHRDESIDVQKAANEIRYLEYMASTGLLPAVRTVRFKNLWRHEPSMSQDLASLCRLLDQMTGLRDVLWGDVDVNYLVIVQYPIPGSLLQSLKLRPQVQLHAAVTSWSLTTRASLLNISILTSSPNLRSLRVDVDYVQSFECLETVRPLKGLLLSCPNLRKLSLDIHLPQDGCIYHELTRDYCGLGFSKGERPPALEDLEIVAYPWGHHSSNWGYGSVGYPEKGTEQDYWAEHFDWSRLRRLVLPDASLAQKISQKLTSLKEIGFLPDMHPRPIPVYDRQAAASFLREVAPTLESITVPQRFMRHSMTPILRHGLSLRKLALIRRSGRDHWEDHAISNEHLFRLRDGLPHLEELVVSVANNAHNHEHWAYDTLDILAGFQSLRWLKLSLELAIPEGKVDTPAPPYLTMSSADSLFRYLREHSRGEPPSLQRLEVSTGEASLCDLWLDANSTSFIVCKVPGDAGKEGSVKVTCTKLGEERNQRMRSIIRQEEQPSSADLAKVNFKVALDGPMSKSLLEDMRQTDPLPPYIGP